MMFRRFFLFLICAYLYTGSGIAQNSVGLISFDFDFTQDGYNLIYPHNQPNVYLLNACGEVVHTWVDDAGFRPGNVAYILENGNLYKTKRPEDVNSLTFGAGGAGGIIELRDWDNNLLWSRTYMDTLRRAHHDLAPLPNGNVLAIIWERKTLDEVLAAGGDTTVVGNTELWPDFIVELNPFTDSVVWEWHAWDHLIQDYDPTKENFGVVEDHPERIDLNYDLREFGLKPDWMHTNGIDYNPRLDQIMICVPNFHELWVIDHSTTTEEARGHSGGRSGRGGDLLYRWGNPESYRAGTEEDKKFFYQHDTHWNDDFISENNPLYGNISLFNNRVGPEYSTVNGIVPAWNEETWSYEMKDGRFLPEDFDWTILHPDTFEMASSGLSSAQVLDNLNRLVTVGRTGYSFEITPSHEIVWEYVTPLRRGDRVSQGETLERNDNITFRMNRYPLSYEAFENRDLSAKDFIELNPDEDFCDFISTATEDVLDLTKVSISPNPVSDYLYVKTEELVGSILRLTDINGREVIWSEIRTDDTILELSGLSSGLYFVSIGTHFVQKVIVSN